MSGAWLAFLASALAIVVAGTALSRAADVIAEKSRLGGLWVGSILLAGATSLPEVVTSISAGVMGLPDIAVGNVFGSNVFNLFIIALADLVEGRGALLRKVSAAHILSAVLGMLLSAIGAVAILLRLPGGILGVGWATLLIAAVYGLGTRMLTLYAQRDPEEQAIVAIDPPPEWIQERQQRPDPAKEMSLGRAYGVFALAGLVVTVAGVALSRSGDALAESTGLGQTFVGSILVAAATSLPEVVATMSAVMAGSYDLAVGNVFGSNIFNMVILLLSDVAYRPGPILAAVDPSHATVALFGLIMSGIAVIGLFYRCRRSIARLGLDSVALAVAYFASMYLLYISR
ncbi:MAG: sodium:calcium antiporter [Limnochordales bacterium]|nr:sodium:calcium antiporter [Limnochordales bacterium]